MTSVEDWREEVAPKEAAIAPVPEYTAAAIAAASDVGSGGTRAQKWPRV